jgi:hypothetical protein
MLPLMEAGRYPNLGNLVGETTLLCFRHHTDAEREWADNRTSSIGRFGKGIDEATAKNWTVLNMKQDWKACSRQSDAERHVLRRTKRV